MEDSLDEDGYPTQETLDKISSWKVSEFTSWIEFVKSLWHPLYGCVEMEKGTVRLSTGGWSGNEDIIKAMQLNFMWDFSWLSSYRGEDHILMWSSL